jgi:A/G-specific adenine glycosylase
LLVMRHPQHGVWLERRPSSGIWAGLHCFPVYSSREDLVSSLPASWVEKMVEKPAQLHVLTHRDLHLHFCEVQTDLSDARSEHGQWILPSQAGQWGLPKPVIDHLCSVRGGASG